MQRIKRKIEAMHDYYGYADPSELCKNCCNFLSGKYHNKTLRKCRAYGCTHSAASDWNAGWLACGYFNQPWRGETRCPYTEYDAFETDPQSMIEILKGRPRGPKDTDPVDGQVSMFENPHERQPPNTGTDISV